MSSTLSKVSKKVRKDEDTSKGLDKLQEQLKNGELHAGLGAKKLPGTKTVFYMRSGGEARLFFKYSEGEKATVKIIAESDKDSETRVIDNLKKNYK
jgi:mRNA-degrading endonuclease RelE of RelBE toxin-antitoxin system